MVIEDNSQFDKVDRGYSDTVVLAFALKGEHRRLVYVPRLVLGYGTTRAREKSEEVV